MFKYNIWTLFKSILGVSTPQEIMTNGMSVMDLEVSLFYESPDDISNLPSDWTLLLCL